MDRGPSNFSVEPSPMQLVQKRKVTLRQPTHKKRHAINSTELTQTLDDPSLSTRLVNPTLLRSVSIGNTDQQLVTANRTIAKQSSNLNIVQEERNLSQNTGDIIRDLNTDHKKHQTAK